MSRLASLVVKAGAVVVILLLDPQFSIDLQLIGGVIIVQTLPAVVIGLYTRAAARVGPDRRAGRSASTAGFYMLYDTPNPVTGKAHFGGAQYALSNFGHRHEDDGLHRHHRARAEPDRRDRREPRACRGRTFEDRTSPDDYDVEAGDPGVQDLPATPDEAAVPAGRR